MEPFRNRLKTVFANLSQASTEASRAPKGAGEGVTQLFKDTGTVAPSHVRHAGNSKHSKHKSWRLPSLYGNCPREILLRNKSPAPAQGKAIREWWGCRGHLLGCRGKPGILARDRACLFSAEPWGPVPACFTPRCGSEVEPLGRGSMWAWRPVAGL